MSNGAIQLLIKHKIFTNLLKIMTVQSYITDE